MNSYISSGFVFSKKQIRQLKNEFAKRFEWEPIAEHNLELITIDDILLSLNKPMSNTINCTVEAHYKDNEDNRHTERLLLVLPCRNGKPDGRKSLRIGRL